MIILVVFFLTEDMFMSKNLKGSLILILCAFIWGMAFSAQSAASGYMGPFSFVFMRCIITSAVLFCIYPLFRKLGGKKKTVVPKKRLLVLGSVLGVIFFAAGTLQQAGLSYTTAAKSGFITALYIVMIPIIGLFTGKLIGKLVWIGVFTALVGLILLCLKDDLSINIGDLITLGCAFVFSLHIIVVDKYCGELDSILLNAIQFGVAALISLPVMLIWESITWESIQACIVSILYASVCSGAIGYTLQFVGQKYTEPTLASLLMCLESVFAALGGWVLLGQGLTARELFGCILMLSASVIAQLPDKHALPRN